MLITFIDYALITIIFYLVFKLIRNTDGFKIAIFISFVYGISILAGTLSLNHTAALLESITYLLTFGTVLVFYPELRMFFRKISSFTGPKKPTNAVLSNIEDALFALSEKKYGALIIIDNNGDISSVAENSNSLNAKISSSLLQTVFHPNTPLHDGAVIIEKEKIQYAGCKLPLSARKRTNFGNLGTRHMVAIETAENFNTIVFTVSEETGAIRIATKKGLHLISTRQEFKDYFNNFSKNLS